MRPSTPPRKWFLPLVWGLAVAPAGALGLLAWNDSRPPQADPNAQYAFVPVGGNPIPLNVEQRRALLLTLNQPPARSGLKGGRGATLGRFESSSGATYELTSNGLVYDRRGGAFWAWRDRRVDGMVSAFHRGGGQEVLADLTRSE